MISGTTALIAHLGWPTHSFKAPSIYNPYFEHAGIDAVVVPMGCRPESYPAFLRAVFTLEKRVDMEPERDLDGLAGRACGRDDDHAPGRRFSGDERAVIGGQRAVLNLSKHGQEGCKDEAVAGGRRALRLRRLAQCTSALSSRRIRHHEIRRLRWRYVPLGLSGLTGLRSGVTTLGGSSGSFLGGGAGGSVSDLMSGNRELRGSSL